MKRNRFAALLLAAALLLGAGTACTPAEQAPAGPTVAEILETLTSPEMEGRVSGSTGNQKAAEYIAGVFEAQGLEPLFEDWYQEYEGRVFQPAQAAPELSLTTAEGEVQVLEAGRDFLCSLTREAVELELPVSDDPEACREGGGVYYAPDYLSGVAWLRENPGGAALSLDRVQSGEVITLMANYPGCMLVLDRSFASCLEEGAVLRLEMEPGFSEGTLRNVAAVRRGSEGKNALIFGAHFDGSGMTGSLLFPSALDNASGTAALLRIAAMVQQQDPGLENDLIFVAFNSEENGMNGSAAFAAWAAEQYESVSFINIDSVGLADTPILLMPQERGDALAAALEPLPWAAEVVPVGLSYNSDHQSFVPYQNCGSVCFGCDEMVAQTQGRAHTPQDAADQLDPELIEDLALRLAEFAAEQGDEEFVLPG